MVLISYGRQERVTLRVVSCRVVWCTQKPHGNHTNIRTIFEISGSIDVRPGDSVNVTTQYQVMKMSREGERGSFLHGNKGSSDCWIVGMYYIKRKLKTV